MEKTSKVKAPNLAHGYPLAGLWTKIHHHCHGNGLSWKHHGKSVMVSRHLGTSALLVLTENDIFPSVCTGESQAGNPICTVLVC